MTRHLRVWHCTRETGTESFLISFSFASRMFILQIKHLCKLKIQMLGKPITQRAGDEFFPEEFSIHIKKKKRKENVSKWTGRGACHHSHLQAMLIQGDIWSRNILRGRKCVWGRKWYATVLLIIHVGYYALQAADVHKN